MLSKILLVPLVGISLTSCASKDFPKEPEIHVCEYLLVMVEGKINFEESKVHCVSDFDPNDPTKDTKYSLPEFLLKKPVSTAVEDYAAKLSWVEKVKTWGEKNCKPDKAK